MSENKERKRSHSIPPLTLDEVQSADTLSLILALQHLHVS